MKEREIFRCDIRNLLFNMSYMDDKIGRRLVAAVEEARKRMYSENNIPLYDSVKGGARLLQKQRDADNLQELLIEDVEILYEIPDASHLAERKFMHKTKAAAEEMNDIEGLDKISDLKEEKIEFGIETETADSLQYK